MSVEFRGAFSVEEVLGHLNELGSDGQLLAGGTDVMPQRLRGEGNGRALVHTEKVADLSGISNGSTISIGPNTTHLEIARSSVIAQACAALAEAASTVGGWQTQAVGTIGGNVCNASPAADLVPPLLVSGAQIHLANARDRRAVSIADFILGRRSTVCGADEMVVGIEVEPTGQGIGEAYSKLGRRSAMEVAIVGVAVRLRLSEQGKVDQVRVATCAVSEVPHRYNDVEAVLDGSMLEPDVVAEAGRLLQRSAEPIDDARSSAAYRLAALPAVLGRAVRSAAERATKGVGR